MGIPTDIFIDPAINANTGSGTIGDPYGDFQDGTSKITWDTANGNWLNLKAGATEIMTAPWELDSYRVAAHTAPVGVRGYTAVAGDGGIADISGGGSVSIYNEADSYIQWQDLHLHSTGANPILVLGGFGDNLYNIEFDNTTGDGVVINNGATGFSIKSCHFHNIAGKGINAVVESKGLLLGNYFKNGANKFTDAIYLGRVATAIDNIISVDGASNGINCGQYAHNVCDNSILASAGTGSGIIFNQTVAGVLVSNVVEGFSGVGGKGFDIGEDLGTVGLNAAYNNTTNYTTAVFSKVWLGDNETLASSPFAKSGADTFANRLTYFAPLDVGNVWGGAINGSDKGAVQHIAAAGGGGRPNLLRRLQALSGASVNG